MTEGPAALGEDVQNVTMTQTSSTTWEVRVSGTDDVVGSIRKVGDDYTATNSGGDVLDGFTSPELAMFGVVAHR